jgi:hypothetical protein
MSDIQETQAEYPLYIEGPELAKVDPSLPDAGLPPAVGVQSFQLFRSSRDVPELADGRPWTYRHHVDMACWKGRLYVAWNSCEIDEDVWPSCELYSTSLDGATWSAPAELFPYGISTCLRMYFFLAPAGRMLAIAGLRINTDNTNELKKGGLVVREISPDHALGEVFTLQCSPGVTRCPPMFDQSTDSGFVEACRSLLADNLFLEQQDYGRLLGPRRMKWHDPANWPGGIMPGSGKWIFGKAMCFCRRKDDLLAVTKMGWVAASRNGGKTWSAPVVPPTFITGGAKAWAQPTADGRYALLYNPVRKNRFPLVLVTSDDGISFRDMRIVQGELPVQRYAGRARSIGPQYTRGISHWASDGSRNDNAIWLVYSMSKEDIWVSRIPLPVTPDEISPVADDFSAAPLGPIVPGWNTYCPKWASVAIAQVPGEKGHCLVLEDSDPYDYARATRLFPQCARVSASFRVMASQSDRGAFEIELMGRFGSQRPVRIALAPEGKVKAVDCERSVNIGTYAPGQWLDVTVDADITRGRFSVTLNGARVLTDACFAQPSDSFARISFRTAEYRGIGGANPVQQGTDIPHNPCSYAIRSLNISSA